MAAANTSIPEHVDPKVVKEAPPVNQLVSESPDLDPIGENAPVQSLFIGMNFGVPWNGGGGEFDTGTSSPQESNISVTFGSNQIECVSAHLTRNIGLNADERSSAEKLVTAIGFGIHDELGQSNGDLALESAVHNQSFDTIKGKMASDTRKNPDDGTMSSYEFALPNKYIPRDLNAMLLGLKRPTRHGEDGLHNFNGLLDCRYSGTAFNYFQIGTMDHILPNHGGIPPACRNVALEFLLLSKQFNNPSNSVIEQVNAFANGEQYASDGDMSIYRKLLGTLFSPVLINTWSPLWIPLFVHTSMKSALLERSDFGLKSFDFKMKKTAWIDINSGNRDVSWYDFEQFSPLYHKVGTVLSRQLEILSENQDIGVDVTTLTRDLRAIDASTFGIDMAPIFNSLAPDDVLKCGLIEVTRLNIIDAFGQSIEITQPLSSASVGLSLETPGDDHKILVRPRSFDESQLLLTFIEADAKSELAQRSTNSLSPICGYILPDHVEWALEVFDQHGEPLGQIAVADRDYRLGRYQSGKLEWQPAPGSEYALGSPPQLVSHQLQSLCTTMIEHGLTDAVRLEEAKRTHPNDYTQWPEGAFSAFMRTIDTSLWNVSPYGRARDSLPVNFSGRPLAIVHASLELAVSEERTETHEGTVEVQLGDLNRTLDGLIGYFIDGDYSQMYSVLETPVTHDSGPDLEHDFVQLDTTITLEANTPRYLTLVLEPNNDIHVTSGFLPQKNISLQHVHKSGLKKVAPSYRFGPLLVEPESVRLPVPDLITPTEWTWASRPDSQSWSDQKVILDDGKAHIPSGRIKAWNGWLKLQREDD